MLKRQLSNALRLGIRRLPFVSSLRRRFRADPLEQAMAMGRRKGWTAAARWLLSAGGDSLLSNSAVHDLLRNDINTDIEIELLLTEVRKELLLGDLSRQDSAEIQNMLLSLVRQCQNNEYVWRVSEAERCVVEERLGLGKQPNASGSWQATAILAMYIRLERLFADAAAGGIEADLSDGIPDYWRSMVEKYLCDYRKERNFVESLPRFGSISGSSSKVVAARYEEYPYPRWLDWEMPEIGHRKKFLEDFFTSEELTFLQRPFAVLVAGCGTGAKAISYALGYGDQADILAIDLSRSSLAYAARMAEKYGVKNIEFLQMDLLDVPELGRTFDIFECSGVLHHLEDPRAGGCALVSVLRDAGIAHISLYSERARHEIVRLRRLHEDRIGDITDDEVREFRWRLLQDDPVSIDERLPLRWDFFDMNRCRDLLFHPLEHRFTLPQVETLLSDLGLEFRGLQRPGLLRDQYWTSLPSKRHRRSLSRWHEFEVRNPQAFANLYEIWSVKREG